MTITTFEFYGDSTSDDWKFELPIWAVLELDARAKAFFHQINWRTQYVGMVTDQKYPNSIEVDLKTGNPYHPQGISVVTLDKGVWVGKPYV